MSRRLILIGALALLALASGLAVALTRDGEERPARVPEGGSRLRGETPAPREPGLLGALAALLGRTAPEAADPPAPATPARAPATARGLAARLPPSRLAAQVLLVGLEGQSVGDAAFTRLTERDFGGVVLEERNYVSAGQIAALAGEGRVVARNAGHLPPLVAAAPEAFADLAPAAPRQLVASGDPARGRAVAKANGEQLKALGVDVVLGPGLDVSVPGAAGEEGTFADEPGVVTRWGRAMTAGYAEAGIGAAPGHFPGQGSAGQDPLAGPAAVGLPVDALAERDLRPFAAVLQTVPMVVVSNASFAAYDAVTPATMTPALTTELLRRELHFKGVAIADNVLGASAASGLSAGEAAVAALAAGCDMVYTRDAAEQEDAYQAILAALRRGELSEGRLREAAGRIIELKRGLGLFAVGGE
jgi:beta-N-acetylhexosaminidase